MNSLGLGFPLLMWNVRHARGHESQCQLFLLEWYHNSMISWGGASAGAAVTENESIISGQVWELIWNWASWVIRMIRILKIFK